MSRADSSRGSSPCEGRLLTCNCCGEVIQVFEFPEPFTDPETFWCVPCMDPRYWGIYPKSRAAVESRRREKVEPVVQQSFEYDPSTTPIPY